MLSMSKQCRSIIKCKFFWVTNSCVERLNEHRSWTDYSIWILRLHVRVCVCTSKKYSTSSIAQKIERCSQSTSGPYNKIEEHRKRLHRRREVEAEEENVSEWEVCVKTVQTADRNTWAGFMDYFRATHADCMERNGLWNWVWSEDYWFSLALLSHLFDIYFRRLQLRLTKKTSISLNNDNQERDVCKSGCYRYNSRHFSCRNFVFPIKIQQRRWHKWRRQWHNYGLFRCCKSITDTVNFIWLKEFIKMQTNFKIFFISGTECRGILSPKWSANHKITKIWPIARFSWVHCMDQSNDFSVPKCTVCWIAKRISTIQGMRTFFSKRELLNFIEHFGCFLEISRRPFQFNDGMEFAMRKITAENVQLWTIWRVCVEMRGETKT